MVESELLATANCENETLEEPSCTELSDLANPWQVSPSAGVSL